MAAAGKAPAFWSKAVMDSVADRGWLDCRQSSIKADREHLTLFQDFLVSASAMQSPIAIPPLQQKCQRRFFLTFKLLVPLVDPTFQLSFCMSKCEGPFERYSEIEPLLADVRL